ncbi:hypothetical protein AB0J82_35505 [Asanoa sp. NPDC049518]|uniref:hypothetical protein n=1 Tax=unclassified Asanoa TaxID=2685164 RepID=UPI00344814D6
MVFVPQVQEFGQDDVAASEQDGCVDSGGQVAARGEVDAAIGIGELLEFGSDRSEVSLAVAQERVDDSITRG